ncbi:hypothetical protein TTHERM_000161579 (macronuclear) [Tetrahymena thermophila SB210]|uniref:Uncharacterized protein n=1 Tax=Tetrahymena thermophila (strain SB210) TaxID=312017 RepID=W7XLA5_TETTS|nr:hypothetical protein TTHERM_000161579 [Tetrahymena thermophila SB210]EWS75949.1 hypothetical protein TTHERM_000161579 [Tetrahymena thermophila SB210]|eukprot:XP_012651467.1 hypothetical protein TTHERM_000161579 [Tetrahymena thermophila SB210]
MPCIKIHSFVLAQNNLLAFLNLPTSLVHSWLNIFEQKHPNLIRYELLFLILLYWHPKLLRGQTYQTKQVLQIQSISFHCQFWLDLPQLSTYFKYLQNLQHKLQHLLL